MAVGNMFRQRRDLSGKRRSPGTLPMFQINQYTQSPLSAAPAQSAGGLSRAPALGALNPFLGGLQGMMMQGLGRAQSLTGQPQSPMSGAYADGVMDREFGRSVDMGNARMTPIFGGSGAAGMASRSYPNVMGRSMANAVNGYVGANPIAMTPQDKLNTAQAAAQRFMGGGPASDPTGLGRRFGPGSPLTSAPPRVTDAQRQQASQEMLRGLDPRAAFGRGQKVYGRQQAGGSMAYTDRLTAMKDYVQANPMDTGARASMEAEAARREGIAQKTQARREAFKAEHGGMNERQFRRSQKEDARTEKKFNQAVMAGLNPMSPQAQALFPGQAAKVRAAMGGQDTSGGKTGRPGAASEAFMPGGRVTAESQKAAGDFLSGLSTGRTDAAGNVTPPPAYFAGMDLSGKSVSGLHEGIMARTEEGIEPTDEELGMMYAAVKAYQAQAPPDVDPFGGDPEFVSKYKSKYETLAGMEDPSPEDLKAWWSNFKKPFVGPVRPGGTPVYNPMLPIRTGA